MRQEGEKTKETENSSTTIGGEPGGLFVVAEKSIPGYKKKMVDLLLFFEKNEPKMYY